MAAADAAWLKTEALPLLADFCVFVQFVYLHLQHFKCTFGYFSYPFFLAGAHYADVKYAGAHFFPFPIFQGVGYECFESADATGVKNADFQHAVLVYIADGKEVVGVAAVRIGVKPGQ